MSQKRPAISGSFFLIVKIYYLIVRESCHNLELLLSYRVVAL